MSAWKGHNHPDVDAVGADEYTYAAPFTPSAVEALFTSSESDSTDSVALTPVSDLDKEEDTELMDDLEYSDHTCHLTVDSDFGGALPESHEEGTIAQTIASGNGIAVTFIEECAHEYPLIHFLAPGNPLLKALVQHYADQQEDSTRLRKYADSREGVSGAPIVCGWAQKGWIKVLSANADTTNGPSVDDLASWSDDFLSSRSTSD